MTTPTYQYYNQLFKNEQLPLCYCNLDLLNENIQAIAKRAEGKNKTIRVATKSVRSTFRFTTYFKIKSNLQRIDVLFRK